MSPRDSPLPTVASTLTGAHNTVFMAHYAHPNFVLQNFINTETVKRNMSIVDIRDENRE